MLPVARSPSTSQFSISVACSVGKTQILISPVVVTCEPVWMISACLTPEAKRHSPLSR